MDASVLCPLAAASSDSGSRSPSGPCHTAVITFEGKQIEMREHILVGEHILMREHNLIRICSRTYSDQKTYSTGAPSGPLPYCRCHFGRYMMCVCVCVCEGSEGDRGGETERAEGKRSEKETRGRGVGESHALATNREKREWVIIRVRAHPTRLCARQVLAERLNSQCP